MFLEPQPTPYDWHFRCFGFPVRVTPWFWVAACVLGYDLATNMPGLQQGIGVALWIGAVFLSILVHELGHAFAMRRYGMDASIVLYHFGGLAIPGAAARWDRPRVRLNPQRQMVISAAGPVAQLTLAAAVYVTLFFSGHNTTTFSILDYVLPESQQPPLSSPALQALVIFLMLPSISWALLNLLPVYPLDGGQITRQACVLSNPWQGLRYSLMLSVAAAAVIAVWGMTKGQPFLGVLFLMLGVSNWQQLQGGSGGGNPW